MTNLVQRLGCLSPPPGTYPWQDVGPYGILIAELLLARTRREVVARVFPLFLNRWPDPECLAEATPTDVWNVVRESGFRRRSDRLVAVGEAITTRFNGRVPRGRENLLSLPGVGDYAADAVRLLAFNGRTMPLDRNVARVAARLFGLDDLPSTSSPYANSELVEQCEQLLVGSVQIDRATFRGMLELSAATCKPQPLCRECPLRSICPTGLVRANEAQDIISSA